MNQNVIEILKSKSIKVPEHHVKPLIAQWEAFQQLKAHPMFVNLADQDIGVRNIPGGDKYEQ